MDSWTAAYGPVHSPPWTKTKGYAPVLIWTVGPDPTARGACSGRRRRSTAADGGAPWLLAGVRPNGGATHSSERTMVGEREEGKPHSPRAPGRVGDGREERATAASGGNRWRTVRRRCGARKRTRGVRESCGVRGGAFYTREGAWGTAVAARRDSSERRDDGCRWRGEEETD